MAENVGFEALTNFDSGKSFVVCNVADSSKGCRVSFAEDCDDKSILNRLCSTI